MAIQQTIQEQLKNAMRTRDAVAMETLRYVLSELKYGKIAKQHELSDEECIEILSKEVKKRKDAIDLFRNSGREELVTEELAKLAHITRLLPEQLDGQAIEAVVDQVIAEQDTTNIGLVIKAVMANLKGRADGRLVSQIVQAKMKT